MPDYALSPGHTDGVWIPEGTVAISVGHATQDTVLVASGNGDAARGATRKVTDSPGQPLLLLARDVDRVTISCLPHRAPRFEPGARVSLEVSTRAPGESERSSIRLSGVDAGGLAEVSLVDLLAEDHGIRVKPWVDPHPALTGIAALALMATAQQGGLTGKHGGAGKDLAVTIDGSASMLPWLHDGSLAAIVDVVAGVDRAFGHDGDLDVRVAWPDQRWGGVPASGAGAAVADTLRDRRPQTGSDLWSLPPRDGAQWVLVTDREPVAVPLEASVVLVLGGPVAAGEASPADPRVLRVRPDPGRTVAQRLAEPDATLLIDVVEVLASAAAGDTQQGDPS